MCWQKDYYLFSNQARQFGGVMVINPDLEPTQADKPRLADLLAAITLDNLPDDQDDMPVGVEVW